MKKSTLYTVQTAIIATLYAVVTVAQNTLLPGSASLPIQFRVSEVMTVLAFFTPVAIPGLTLGCILANLSSLASGLGVYDLLFGSMATLFATLTMRALRNVTIKDIPFFGLLMPAFFNGIIIGFEIDFFFIGSMHFNFWDFLVQSGFVALGELLVLLILGIPFTLTLKKSKIFKTLR